MHSTADTGTTEALYATGHWLHAKGRTKDANSVFRALLLTAPEDERGWLGLAVGHEALGQPEVAIELYRVGSSAAHGSARLALGLGRALRAAGEAEEAETSFRRARELAGTSGDDALVALAESEVAS